jgi:hypothetical protein
MVLAGALIGYLIGASIRRVRHRVAQYVTTPNISET